MSKPLVFLFDVDNTLLDNDGITADLKAYLRDFVGADCEARYWQIFEQLRSELGYADYLGALQRYRAENPRDLDFFKVSYFLLEYPFAAKLYPGALDVIHHFGKFGTAAILTDGDVVFQPWKMKRSGILDAVDGRVLIRIHKEHELHAVEVMFPDCHYVLIDDKLRILSAVKKKWGDRITTVFPRQGHYALDTDIERMYPAPDFTVERIGDLLSFSSQAFGA